MKVNLSMQKFSTRCEIEFTDVGWRERNRIFTLQHWLLSNRSALVRILARSTNIRCTMYAPYSYKTIEESLSAELFEVHRDTKVSVWFKVNKNIKQKEVL